MTCRALRRPTLAELERNSDCAISQDDLDRLKFGSVLAAEIIRETSAVQSARDAIITYCFSGKRWRAKGREDMYLSLIQDARWALDEWRRLRLRLKQLNGEAAGQANAARVIDGIMEVQDGEPVE